ncbi:MAG TPA: calcium-binding protein [Tepidisphaeraceae bacterium]|nr:calcium-binding protein [Tepidisphaeraceae bacterium]
MRTSTLLRAQLESLEHRITLAASASLDSSGLLTILGTDSFDQIRLSLVNHVIRVRVSTDFTPALSRDFASGAVSRISIDAGAGGDGVTVDPLIEHPVTVRGGAGRDNLSTVPPGATILSDFRDSLAPPENSLIQYIEEDVFFVPSSFEFTVETTHDPVPLLNVTLSLSNGEFANESWPFNSDGIVIRLSDPSDIVSVSNQPGTFPLHLQTGLGADTITVRGEGLISVDAGGGPDIINGGTFAGGPAPTLIGGSGDDSIEGSISADVISGGSGSDTIRANGGADTLEGGSGNDRFEYPSGDFVLSGGAGIDKVSYEGSDFSVSLSLDSIANDGPTGSAGNVASDVENLTGGDRADSLHGSNTANVLVGGGGDDTLRGGAGNDTLIGGGGRDKLYGDAGDDLLPGRGGSKDRLDGGDGTDTATADAGPDVFDLVFNVETVN